MGRWIARLHGGQLVMMLLGIAAVGSIIFGVGYNLGREADADFDLYGRLRFGVPSEGLLPDTILANHMIEQGVAANRVALRFLVVGVVVLATIIPALWIWFGARRRDTIVAEVIDA